MGEDTLSLVDLQFEIQVYQNNHWMIDCVEEKKDTALAYAKSKIGRLKVDGVRVIQVWKRPDGLMGEREIYSYIKPISQNISVTTIEASPACKEVSDFYDIDARIVINRILRQYFEELILTPTELMHNYTEMKRLNAHDNLVPTAVAHVARLQAPLSDGGRRRNEIYDVINQMTQRLQVVSRRTFPEIRKHGFKRLYEECQAANDESPEFLARVALSRDLVGMRSWSLKLVYLMELARADGYLPDGPMRIIDGIVADVLGSPVVLQEVVGSQTNLAAVLITILDLLEGQFDMSNRRPDDIGPALNLLLADSRMNQSRTVLLDWVRRQLRSNQPLVRQNQEEGEREVYKKTLLPRLINERGVIGGHGMAEAILARRLQFQVEGSARGRALAIDGVLSDLPQIQDRIRFLLALTASSLEPEQGQLIRKRLNELTSDPDDHINPHSSPRINFQKVTRLWREVLNFPGAPTADRARIGERLDQLLAAYISRGRAIEASDDLHAALRDRATRLVKLCLPEGLESPMALQAARRQIVNHLRQPNFDERFVSDLTSQHEREKALAEFYGLLVEAGFDSRP